MTTKEVCDEIMSIVSQHEGSEAELYDELLGIAEGWKMRLQELEEDDE